MNISAADVWKKVVDNLVSSIGQETVNLWIKPITAISLEKNVLTLSVPNKFFSKWIEENHQYIISATKKK